MGIYGGNSKKEHFGTIKLHLEQLSSNQIEAKG